MKLDFQWPGAIVFAVVFVTLGFLVYVHALPPEVLGAVLAWLVPSPIQPRSPGVTSRSTSSFPLLCILVLGLSVTDCKGTAAPPAAEVEAGVDVVGGACTLLEGVTRSGTIENICATAEEVAQVVAFVLTLRAESSEAPDARACAALSGSSLCATPREIGQGIEFLVRARRARFAIGAT